VPFSPRIPEKPIPWYWYAYGDKGPPPELEMAPAGGFIGGENPEAPRREELLAQRTMPTVF
jgi:hypothetical protein